MSAEKQYVYVTVEDWYGLFLNGILIEEGHSLPADWVFDIVLEHGGRVDRFCKLTADEDWMCDEGNFPVDLREVVLSDGCLLPAGLIFYGVNKS